MCNKRNIYTMSEAQAALMNAFNLINQHFYNGELEKPIITLQEAKTDNFGSFELNKHWVQGDTCRYQINLNVLYLSRPIQDTIATLMHEIVHLYNRQNGIKDYSRGTAYHNKEFLKTAQTHGLDLLEYSKKIGYSQVYPSASTLEWIDKNISIKEFRLYKRTFGISPPHKQDGEPEGEGGEKTEPKKKQSYRKYKCPKCGLIVRATKDCRIACIECKCEMEKVES